MAAKNATKTKQQWDVFSGPAEVTAPRLALVLAVFFLSMLGLVAVFSASSIEALNEGLEPTTYLVRQGANMLIGIVLCVIITFRVPYEWWQGQLLNIFWLAVVGLLLLTALIGTIGLGAQRWVTVAGISGQPSEIAKVALILIGARILYKARTDGMDFNTMLLQVLVLVVMPLGLLFLTQSDLGTTLICLVGILAVVYFSGAKTTTIFYFIVALLGFGLLAILLKGYRSNRITSLFNPEADYYGAGYQLVRSFYAFGEGGLFGVGPGNSSEKYLYLPEAETDFIFAIIGEEMGFVGALAVIVAFLMILWAGLRIAKAAPDLYGSMIAGGCTVMLVFQAFLNIGCVMGVLPTTGKPLPFVSLGGSSIIGSFLLVGIILSVSIATDGSHSVYERRRSNLKVVRSSSSNKQAKAQKSSRRRTRG